MPRTKLEADAIGCDYYSTGKPCKNGHYYLRYASSRNCVLCTRAKSSHAYKTIDKEKERKRLEIYRENNRDEINRKSLEWAEKNRDKRRSVSSASAKKNRHKHIAYQAAKCAERHAKNKQAKPSWVDMEDIKPFYEESRRMTKETGIIHHVDHIVPITGKNVCGLHVPWNLRVITRTENVRKRNKLLEELL